MKKVFLIDNYDSFTYNLVSYLEELNCEVLVRRNYNIDIKEIDGYENISLKTDEKPNNMKYIACKNNYILYDKHNEINKHIQNFY